VLPRVEAKVVAPSELGDEMPRVATLLRQALLFTKAKTFEEDLASFDWRDRRCWRCHGISRNYKHI
jgi:hypothetical protein